MRSENKVLGEPRRLRLLDLFCGAGGAAVGYSWAGFEVVGVDIDPQPNYPFEFHQADAMTYPLDGFDAIHASPPCQAYSAGSRMRTGSANVHPKLIEPTREKLIKAGLPWVIENVETAPLIDPIRLCGSTFGLGVRRHRMFESSIFLRGLPCAHYDQPLVIGVYGDHPEDAPIYKGKPARRAKSVQHAREVMDIDWMQTWHELKESIPPAFTEHVGKQLMAAIVDRVAA